MIPKRSGGSLLGNQPAQILLCLLLRQAFAAAGWSRDAERTMHPAAVGTPLAIECLAAGARCVRRTLSTTASSRPASRRQAAFYPDCVWPCTDARAWSACLVSQGDMDVLHPSSCGASPLLCWSDSVPPFVTLASFPSMVGRSCILVRRSRVAVYRCAAPVELLWLLWGNGIRAPAPRGGAGRERPLRAGALSFSWTIATTAGPPARRLMTEPGDR